MKQNALFGTARKNVDLIVDVSNLAYRAAHRFKELSADGVPTGHVYGAFSMLLSLVKHHGKPHNYRIILAVDRRSEWRRTLLPAYKANRKADGRQFSTATEEVLELFSLVPRTATLWCDDYEADDMIMTHIHNTPAREHVVLSQDRDIWQVIDEPSTTVLVATKEKPITVFDVRDTFLTDRPALIPLAKALMGDTSDNIPGVKGFSKKDAATIMASYPSNKLPSYKTLMLTADALSGLAPRTLPLLEANADSIRKTIKVCTLSVVENATFQTTKPDLQELANRLTKLACHTTVDRLGELA